MNKAQAPDSGGASVSILIADDHPLFLKGLEEMIEETPDWHIVSTADDGREALDQIRQFSPDIAILDISMPEMDGLEVARAICEQELSTAVIILTMYDDELLISRAMSYGVKGFILKDSAIDDIAAGVAAVAGGGYFLSPQLTDRLFHGNPEVSSLSDVLKMDLTRMERKVIKLVSEDRTTREIAEALFISPKTVENHRANICRKLKLHGKNALLRYVLEHKETLHRILQEC